MTYLLNGVLYIINEVTTMVHINTLSGAQRKRRDDVSVPVPSVILPSNFTVFITS